MKKYVAFFLLLLSGCSIIGAAFNISSKVGSIVMDEREMSDDWLDTKINMSVRNQLMQSKISYAMDIEITVFEGQVMLNGAIPTIEDLEKIIEITWQVDGVEKVYNEIRLDQPATLSEAMQDAILASSIRTKLLATSGITSVNYKITVDHGTLYMMGIAKDQQELNAVMNIIQQTNGITAVVSHIRQSFSH